MIASKRVNERFLTFFSMKRLAKMKNIYSYV